MAKLKHNAPCHCGSGKKYRSCHLQADRRAAGRAEAAPEPSPVQQAQPALRPPRPRWLRMLPYAVGLLGSAVAVWVAVEHSAQGGVATFVATGLAMAAIVVFGDPPPPKDDAGDPSAINFGR